MVNMRRVVIAIVQSFFSVEDEPKKSFTEYLEAINALISDTDEVIDEFMKDIDSTPKGGNKYALIHLDYSS